MLPAADAFASPPDATEGAHYPKPRPLRSVTSAGKETFYLSSEESVGSSNGELSSLPKIFAGVLRDLGVDPEEKKKKPSKKKKKADVEVTSKGPGASRATTAAVKAMGKTGAGGSKGSGSAGSRNPDADATPSQPEDEEEEEEETAPLIGRKRGRSEATTGMASAPVSVVIPVVGKKSKLRSLYQFSPEIKKKTPEKGVKFVEPSTKRPKVATEPSDSAARDAAKTAEAQQKAEEDRRKEESRIAAQKKAEELKRKEEEEKKRKEEEERKLEAERKRKRKRRES
ncbi:translation initiation factor IF-2-like isoform X2 [Helianthus annuus]|uniref:translation initiation factor IF-2-like isoform X2 n=1 Tax=Helianthus annuus TaxID=4232 RepID=UPI0016533D15|nr:translation initiation factor IF-2-like isoform X2 [Helianthus annuus]